MQPIGAPVRLSAATQALLAQVDTSSDAALTRISQHDVCVIGADRRKRSLRVRQILRADRQGADRWVVAYFVDTERDQLPELLPVRGCAVGKQVTDLDAGILVAELLFDVPLARGDTLIMEHEFRYHRAPALTATEDSYTRGLRLPTREYVLEVHFDPAVLPADCQEHRRDADGGPAACRKLEPDRHGRVHALALGYGPGEFGIRWSWPG
ncbi:MULTISPECIES: hypothetical protein [unclassified Crossiella]|uniref:hypothetical protein n=1 Tax=unclassified Crossiella TaxID=2620835 RepID=UPI001FFF1844|nr:MULTISPECIES: hypothetical protein [unclassified Crossiella]MCK2238788.1 hypothetical protein [Crossiella sp. S99.2]MCK2251642.1 hypothetical protein [Crossiella sp. S99.1]